MANNYFVDYYTKRPEGYGASTYVSTVDAWSDTVHAQLIVSTAVPLKFKDEDVGIVAKKLLEVVTSAITTHEAQVVGDEKQFRVMVLDGAALMIGRDLKKFNPDTVNLSDCPEINFDDFWNTVVPIFQSSDNVRDVLLLDGSQEEEI